MSLYDDDGGLYGETNQYESVGVEQSGPVQFDPQPQPAQTAVIPAASISAEVLPATAGPSVPWGLAVLGICIVGVIWANSIDGNRE